MKPTEDMNLLNSGMGNITPENVDQFYKSAVSTIQILDENIQKLKKSLDDSSTPFFKRALFKYQLAEMEFKRNKVIEVVNTVKGLGIEGNADVLKELDSLIASKETDMDESKKEDKDKDKDKDKSNENDDHTTTATKTDQTKKEGGEKEKEKGSGTSDQEKKIEEIIEKIKKDPVCLELMSYFHFHIHIHIHFH